MAQTEAELLDNPVAGRPTLILRSPDFHAITEAVAGTVERSTPMYLRPYIDFSIHTP